MLIKKVPGLLAQIYFQHTTWLSLNGTSRVLHCLTFRPSPSASTLSVTARTKTPSSASFSLSPASTAYRGTTRLSVYSRRHGDTRALQLARWWLEGKEVIVEGMASDEGVWSLFQDKLLIRRISSTRVHGYIKWGLVQYVVTFNYLDEATTIFCIENAVWVSSNQQALPKINAITMPACSSPMFLFPIWQSPIPNILGCPLDLLAPHQEILPKHLQRIFWPAINQHLSFEILTSTPSVRLTAEQPISSSPPTAPL